MYNNQPYNFQDYPFAPNEPYQNNHNTPYPSNSYALNTPSPNYPLNTPSPNYPLNTPSPNYPPPYSQEDPGRYQNQGYNNSPPNLSSQKGFPGANPSYPQQNNLRELPHQGGVYPDGMSSAAYSVPDDDPTSAFAFSDKTIRNSFIRKVYSILTVQLLIVVGFVAFFIFYKDANKYFQVHYEYLIAALITVVVLMIVLVCCYNVRRTAPMNYICLFLFTIAFSFLVGLTAGTYNVDEVMLAVGMTAAVTLVLTIFAFQTKIDFTLCAGALFSLLIVLIIGAIFAAFFPSKIMNTVIAGLGAFIMSLYIVYDTQRMIGRNAETALSPEEYVFAALNLYLDIVNLFLYILQIVGHRN